MSSLNKFNDQPLLGEGGITHPAVPLTDPFAALFDLMVVVEALCPKWPQREPFKEGSQWKL